MKTYLLLFALLLPACHRAPALAPTPAPEASAMTTDAGNRLTIGTVALGTAATLPTQYPSNSRAALWPYVLTSSGPINPGPHQPTDAELTRAELRRLRRSVERLRAEVRRLEKKR
jgi:hypothetical protein